MQGFRSLQGASTFEVNIKRSVFIGNATFCETEDEARAFIKEISNQYRDATHNCWAYRLSLQGRELFNFSDAGEPHGSAGRPILAAIDQLEITNVVVIVSRYFGGTKLGVRGLIDAYRDSAAGALMAGKICSYSPGSVITFNSSYRVWNDFTHLMTEGKDYSGSKLEFGAQVSGELLCEDDHAELILTFFRERLALAEITGTTVFVSEAE